MATFGYAAFPLPAEVGWAPATTAGWKSVISTWLGLMEGERGMDIVLLTHTAHSCFKHSKNLKDSSHVPHNTYINSNSFYSQNTFFFF